MDIDSFNALPAWPDLDRQRKAIVIVDVVESVRLMLANEADLIVSWRRFVHEVETEVLPARGGRLVKSLGDGLLMEFDAIADAVQAAQELQRRAAQHNMLRPPETAMRLRVGVHSSEVVRDSHDIYGTGVNLAARICSVAGPGEIVVSADVRDQLLPGVDGDVEDLGDCFLKGFAQPVRVYRLGAAGAEAAPAAEEAPALQPAVAVIPFDAGAEASSRIVGELVADGVIARLSLSADLRVISRLSCSAFAGRGLPPQAIGQHLGTDYLVSGLLLVVGERLRVTVELCETRTGQVIWADGLGAALAELTDPDNTLIERIAEAVHAAILHREVQRARTQFLPTLHSHSLLLGAIHLMHRQSRQEFGRAKALLEALSERHARHATPRAWLAKWHAVSAAQGWMSDPHNGVLQARRQVEQALASDPRNGLAWAIKGLLLGYVDADFDAADAAYRQALEVNPNESMAWLYLATLEGWRGNAEPAVDAAERALRLSPVDPLKYYFDSLAGAAMLGAGRYARAVELSQRSIRNNRAHLSTFRVLAMAQVLAGDGDGARTTVAEMRRQDPGYSVALFMKVSPWRVSPDVDRLAAALREAGVPEH